MPSVRSWLRRGRARVQLGGRRVRASAIPIVQCALAAGVAWFLAADLIGHERPFFAPIAAVISLGVALGARLRRVVEMVVGVSLGVLVGDLLVLQIGSGTWQIMLVVALAMGLAVFTNGATLLVAQAGSSAVLVATLLPPGGTGGIDRCVDALIGGLVGVVIAGVLPADPVGPVRREARALLDELAGVLSSTADALRDRDADAALDALRRARDTQPMIDSLRGALKGGHEITRVAPFLRRRRTVLSRYTELATRADYAVRNARVLARRTWTAISDDEPAAPELADAMTELAGAITSLTAELYRDGDRTRVREPVIDVVRHTVALQEDWTPGPSEVVIVAQLRSIALDLLQGTGMSRDEGLTAMRRPT